jgi:hypothetical protein
MYGLETIRKLNELPPEKRGEVTFAPHVIEEMKELLESMIEECLTFADLHDAVSEFKENYFDA